MEKKACYGIKTENQKPILYQGTEKEAENLWNRIQEARDWNIENPNTEPPQNTLRAMTRNRCWYIYNGFEMSIETPEEKTQRLIEEQQQQQNTEQPQPEQPQPEQPQPEQNTETPKTHKKTTDTTEKKLRRIFAELARIKEEIAELQMRR